MTAHFQVRTFEVRSWLSISKVIRKFWLLVLCCIAAGDEILAHESQRDLLFYSVLWTRGEAKRFQILKSRQFIAIVAMKDKIVIFQNFDPVRATTISE